MCYHHSHADWIPASLMHPAGEGAGRQGQGSCGQGREGQGEGEGREGGGGGRQGRRRHQGQGQSQEQWQCLRDCNFRSAVESVLNMEERRGSLQLVLHILRLFFVESACFVACSTEHNEKRDIDLAGQQQTHRMQLHQRRTAAPTCRSGELTRISCSAPCLGQDLPNRVVDQQQRAGTHQCTSAWPENSCVISVHPSGYTCSAAALRPALRRCKVSADRTSTLAQCSHSAYGPRRPAVSHPGREL